MPLNKYIVIGFIKKAHNTLLPTLLCLSGHMHTHIQKMEMRKKDFKLIHKVLQLRVLKSVEM